MAEQKYYCFTNSNNKAETMTKEQILTAISQAVSTGTIQEVDTGFVSKLKVINRQDYITFWIGSQAEYNALESYERNCFYLITNDITYVGLQGLLTEIDNLKVISKEFDSLKSEFDEVKGLGDTVDNIIKGTEKVGVAKKADSVSLANYSQSTGQVKQVYNAGTTNGFCVISQIGVYVCSALEGTTAKTFVIYITKLSQSTSSTPPNGSEVTIQYTPGSSSGSDGKLQAIGGSLVKVIQLTRE